MDGMAPGKTRTNKRLIPPVRGSLHEPGCPEEKVYLQHVSKKDAADREEERLMELKRRWAELALPPETFKGL